MPAPGEFELIRRFFERPGRASRVRLGIGDDCALIDAPEGETLAVSTDMLVEGRHFFAGTDPASVGHKALAVNLSDLAAMGARPLAFTLALALPEADERWLAGFSGGLLALADAHGCELAGGDTTRGPLNLCITVFGAVPAGEALRRDGARAGDDLWVSGALGAAALAVEHRRRGEPVPAGAAARLDRPEPRVALGLALRGLASAAIDLSDGLAGDLGHVLARSGAARGGPLGATLDEAAIPFAPELAGRPRESRLALALGGGDDYELLFAASPARRAAVAAAGAAIGLTLARIGRVDPVAGLRLVAADGSSAPLDVRSFDHFR